MDSRAPVKGIAVDSKFSNPVLSAKLVDDKDDLSMERLSDQGWLSDPLVAQPMS